MTKRRNVIVHIATSADGYIARTDGDLEWLTSRPVPEGFYGMNAFMRSIDTTILGRKTYEVSLRLGVCARCRLTCCHRLIHAHGCSVRSGSNQRGFTCFAELDDRWRVRIPFSRISEGT